MNQYNPYYDADMQNKLAKKAALRQIRRSVLCALAMVFISYLSSAVSLIVSMILAPFFPILSGNIGTKFVEMLVYTVQFVFPVIFYLFYSGKSMTDVFHVDISDADDTEKPSFKGMLSYFVIAFSLSQIMAVLTSIITTLVSTFGSLISEKLVLNEEAFSMPLPQNGWEFLLELLAAAFLPALLEEILFRGVLLSEFIKYGKTFAITVSAFFFCSMHGSLEQIMFSFVYGIIFGYVAVKTGSLKTGIIIHFTNNAYSCTVQYWGEIYGTDLFWNIVAVINIILIVSGLFTAIFKLIKGSFGYSEITDAEKAPYELTEKEKFSVFVSPVMICYYAFIILETLYVYISYNMTK